MRPSNTKILCCTFAYFELFVYGINREIISWKMTMRKRNVRVGQMVFHPFPYQLVLFVGDSTLDYFLRIKCITNFRLFGKDSQLMFILYNFV